MAKRLPEPEMGGCLSLVVGFLLLVVLAMFLLVLIEVISYVCPLALASDPDSACIMWPLT